MQNTDAAQPGVLSDPAAHAEYLTFALHETVDPDAAAAALAFITNVEKSIGQKDATAALSVTVGFGALAWPRLFPGIKPPAELHEFEELSDGGRHFPSTGGDIFIMVKCNRLDLRLQAAKYLVTAFRDIASVTDDVPGFAYLDNRDLIDFVDGTENPKGVDRAAAVLVDNDPGYGGGSYVIVQRYRDRQDEWDALSVEDQEGAIGRTKFDDIEIDDDKKTPYAHNVKSKVEVDGVEVKMFRQNRAYGSAVNHGTMFIGFAKSPSVVETSLQQMIIADSDGHYDRLLDFVDAETGALFFTPPQTFLDSLAG